MLVRTAAVLTLALATVLAAPAASAQPENPVKCLLGPVIPEELVYYHAWRCTAGQYVPEPVDTYTGCHVYFGLRVECYGGLSDLVHDLTGCRVGFPDGSCQA